MITPEHRILAFIEQSGGEVTKTQFTRRFRTMGMEDVLWELEGEGLVKVQMDQRHHPDQPGPKTQYWSLTQKGWKKLGYG